MFIHHDLPCYIGLLWATYQTPQPDVLQLVCCKDAERSLLLSLTGASAGQVVVFFGGSIPGCPAALCGRDDLENTDQFHKRNALFFR